MLESGAAGDDAATPRITELNCIDLFPPRGEVHAHVMPRASQQQGFHLAHLGAPCMLGAKMLKSLLKGRGILDIRMTFAMTDNRISSLENIQCHCGSAYHTYERLVSFLTLEPQAAARRAITLDVECCWRALWATNCAIAPVGTHCSILLRMRVSLLRE